MACIFCGTEENLTEEHLFPAFSGANLIVPDASCQKCNSQCGDFENVVARLTETARHIFEIPNRYGRIPTAPVKVEIQGGDVTVPGRRKPDGEVEVFDFVAKTKTDDGNNVREGFFVSEESETNSLSDPAQGERRPQNEKCRKRSFCCQPVSRLLILPSHLKHGKWQQRLRWCRWRFGTREK
jgi:HNH endonuclease